MQELTGFEKLIYDYVRLKNHVSFAELERDFPQFVCVENKSKLELIVLPDYSNLIIWWGWSKRAIEALQFLIANKLLQLEAASSFIYLIDGLMPTMPIAKKARQYKKPHWLPTMLCVPKGVQQHG